METTERDPGVPKGKAGEGGVTRRLRIGGTPREGRIYGLRRVPRSLAAGILMMGVLIWFFAGLSGNPVSFLIGFSIIVGIFFLVVWALALAPIRARFDQRWKPKRRIEMLDTTGWKTVADKFGAKFKADPLPEIDGAVDGVPFRLAFFQRGSARTVVVARLSGPVHGKVKLFPRRARFKTKETAFTGDRDFDRAYHLQCSDPAAVKRLFTPEARLRVSIAEPESVEVERGNVVVRRKRFVDDATRLRDMIRAAVSLAR